MSTMSRLYGVMQEACLNGALSVWVVRGDELQALWMCKEDAERYCREMYPNETPSQRYSRVMSKQIHTYE